MKLKSKTFVREKTKRQHVAIQPKLSRVIVIWTYVVSSSHSELLKGGMAYRKASSAATRSTRSRMVSMQRGRSRWATSWTNQSAWPSGHTRSADSSPEQVRPHLVSYLVRKKTKKTFSTESEQRACVFRGYNNRIAYLDYFRALRHLLPPDSRLNTEVWCAITRTWQSVIGKRDRSSCHEFPILRRSFYRTACIACKTPIVNLFSLVASLNQKFNNKVHYALSSKPKMNIVRCPYVPAQNALSKI